MGNDQLRAEFGLTTAGTGVTVAYATYAAGMRAACRISAPFEGVPVPQDLAQVGYPVQAPAKAVPTFAGWRSGEFPAVERQVGDIGE